MNASCREFDRIQGHCKSCLADVREAVFVFDLQLPRLMKPCRLLEVTLNDPEIEPTTLTTAERGLPTTTVNIRVLIRQTILLTLLLLIKYENSFSFLY